MPNILHLFWQPDSSESFLQNGGFRLWMETPSPAKTNSPSLHPRQLNTQELAAWLKETLSQPISPALFESLLLHLPTANNQPLPCQELLSEADEDMPELAEWGRWTIECYRLANAPIHTINEMHYRLLLQDGEVRPGQDFLFWYYYTQSLRQLLLKDQYIPALRSRQQKKRYEFHAAWEFLSDHYDDLLAEAAERMPPSAAPGFEAATVLRHCADVLLRQAAGQAKLTQALQKKVESTFLPIACGPPTGKPWYTTTNPNLGQQWTKWRRRVAGAGGERKFQLALQLHEPETETPEHWRLEFRVWSRRDPSLQVPLADYWPLSNQECAHLLRGCEFFDIRGGNRPGG